MVVAAGLGVKTGERAAADKTNLEGWRVPSQQTLQEMARKARRDAEAAWKAGAAISPKSIFGGLPGNGTVKQLRMAR